MIQTGSLSPNKIFLGPHKSNLLTSAEIPSSFGVLFPKRIFENFELCPKPSLNYTFAITQKFKHFQEIRMKLI